jgi:TolB-like protein/Tfp pilus assembly protein PilF
MHLPLLAELQHRRVFRALVGYAIAAFAVLQVVEPLMHGLRWPDAVISYVVAALAVGFPLVVGLAWIFDVKAAGTVLPAPMRSRRLRLEILLAWVAALAAAGGMLWYVVARPRAVAPSRDEVLRATLDAIPPASEIRPLPSIAVLPFVNLSAEKEQEYFSDGMAEEILNALAQIDGLRVIGRTSSFSFKGQNEDLRTIGHKLGASNLLEGSVRKAGSRIRITAQLVETRGGSHLWSQAFDRDLTDVFGVQEEIARAVVAALKVKLLPGETPTAKERTANPDVYRLYLLGRHAWNQANSDGWRRAVTAFQDALALDPKYAPAWAGLAHAIVSASTLAATSTEWVQEYTRALSAAEKAVALAPDLADGYVARARLRAEWKFDWAGGAADVKRALALNPSEARAFRVYCNQVLVPLGRIPEAIAAARKATELDPLLAYYWNALGDALWMNGEMDAARSALTRSHELSPEFVWPTFSLASMDLLEGQPAKALERYEQISIGWMWLTGLALAQHDLGHAGKSNRALEALIRGHTGDSPYQIAQVYAHRRELDRAFEWLERAYALPDTGLLIVKSDPLLRNLRGDPRYRALLKKMNLPLD